MSKAIHERYFANDIAALQAAHVAIARTLHKLVGAMRAGDELQVRSYCGGLACFAAALRTVLCCCAKRNVLMAAAALNVAAGASCAAPADMHAPL
jgi:hypothetical protein